MAGTIFPSILPEASDREAFDNVLTDGLATEAEQLDAGECPFCGESGFDDAHQHARMAHPDAYDDAVGDAGAEA